MGAEERGRGLGVDHKKPGFCKLLIRKSRDPGASLIIIENSCTREKQEKKKYIVNSYLRVWHWNG